MATPQNVSKLDMSLDEIIKMNKKIQHKDKQKSKGPSRAQGGGKGGQKRDGGGKSSGNDQSKLKPTAKKVRQSGGKRTPQNSNSGTQGTKTSKRRSGNTPAKNRQRPSQSQSATPHSTGIKSRLGVTKVTAKGKQQVVKQIFTNHGQNRGGKNDSGKGQRPGSRIKIIRELKGARSNPSNRGKGNAPLKQLEIVKDRSKQNNKTPRSVGADKRGANNQGAQTGRGRKQGGRGGKQAGHGKATDKKGRTSPSEVPKKQPEFLPKPMPSVPRLPPFDPPGVDLPLRICMDHHTAQPLNRRFTPQLKGQNTQRLVQKGGRTINYSK